jgi:hypothetical protein
LGYGVFHLEPFRPEHVSRTLLRIGDSIGGGARYNAAMTIPDANLKALAAFAEIAAEYCRFIDSLRAGRPERLYSTLETLLLNVHGGILPVQEEMAETKHPEYDALAMTHEQWQGIADVIEVAVCPETTDLSGWHRSIDTNEAVARLSECNAGRAEGLSDDLADICRDLHGGLALWEAGTSDSRAEAAWQWRWGYEYHWGEHLFRATLTTHEIRYQLFRD